MKQTYHIMFVDDDALILRRLHQILDWEELGFQILPDASDGIEAMRLLSDQLPDIIICDINMPNMDGLQLISHIRETYPSVQCVLLTVNDSFGCAQQALNMGVCHYLLKPIEADKLHRLLSHILTVLNTSRQQEEYIDTLYSQAMISERMIREKFLNWIVSGRQPFSEKQLREKFSFYRILLDGSEFCIISIHVNSFEKQILNKENMDEMLRTITKCAEDSLCDYENCVVFTDSFYHLNILYCTDSPSMMPGQNTDFLCRSLRDNLLFQLNLPVTIFYSRTYQGYQNIYRCYYDTKFLSHYTQSVINLGIISFEDYMASAIAAPIDFDSIRSTVLKQLRAGSSRELKEYIVSLLTPYTELAHYESLNMLRIDLVMTGIMFLQENKTALSDAFGKYYDPLTEIMEQDDPSSCTQFLCNYYETILACICTSKVSSGRRLAEKCMELVDDNISNSCLSVKWLASMLYVNENYLSRQFHKELGNPLIKYINRRKLETAKNYLDDGMTNLQQVAQLTGFADPLYFSKCFKKYYGVAPSQYMI